MAHDKAVAALGVDDFELPQRKKPKVSELPLSSAQRASIDGMLHTFKKKGEFDAIRKKAFQQYNESAQRGMFEASLRTFTTTEIDRDPMKYLKPDRRIAAPLLEGAAARADVYGKTEEDIDRYIDQYIANAERILRDIRIKEIGEAAAQEEYEKGRISDEAYAAEAEQRRTNRAKAFAEEEKKRKKAEANERKRKELELWKKKQEQLQKEMDRLQREAKRRAEREAFKAAEKEKERERIRKYNEERERQKKEAEERERAAQEEREKRRRERTEMEQKRIEAEALDLLLKDAQRMSDKGRRPGLERSESMEPPPGLMRHPSAPRNAVSKDQMRAQGLMPTSLTLRKGDKPLPTASAAEPERPRASRPRSPRPRSPSPARSSHGTRRREPSPADRLSRKDKDRDRRESLYRDISAEREAWKARQKSNKERPGDQPRERGRAGGDGEVFDRAARSRSRESYRARRDDSRGSRRNHRDRSRSRSPRRPRDRERDRPRDLSSRPRHRDRSRSPLGGDRYIPGSGATTRRDEGPDRRRREDDFDRRRRDEDRDDRDRDRRRPRHDERDRSERHKASGSDRYLPGSGGRPTDMDRPRRQERSRSRERDRERDRGHRDRERERYREQSRERERERDRGSGPKDRAANEAVPSVSSRPPAPNVADSTARTKEDNPATTTSKSASSEQSATGQKDGAVETKAD